MAVKSSFLDALEKATQADLDAINAEIVDLEASLEKRKAQRKMVEILLGVAPKRGKSGPRKKSSAYPATNNGDRDDDDEDDQDEKETPPPMMPDDRRMFIAKLLLKGPRRVADLAEELGTSSTPVYTAINHPWFAKSPDASIHLTAAGRSAATGKPAIP